MRQTNRLETEMKQWDAREQRFSKLFSASILHSREFRKEKLQHLRHLHSKYRWAAANPDEKLTRRLLGRERRELEKAIYPNKLKRNFFRLIHAFQKLVRAIVLPAPGTANHRRLVRDVEKAGFGQSVKTLSRELGQGQASFSIPLSKHIDDRRRLDYHLDFSRDHDGQPRFDGYRVALPGTDGQPKASIRMEAGGHSPSALQAYNLLSGRAVLLGREWISVDENDRDAQGNLRLKSCPEKYGPDIAKELEKLPLKENRLLLAREELTRSLKDGDRVQVSLLKKGKEVPHFLELGRSGKLELLDASGKKAMTGKIPVSGQSIGRQHSPGHKAELKAAGTGNTPVRKGIRISNA